jgi:hypothetical protein
MRIFLSAQREIGSGQLSELTTLVLKNLAPEGAQKGPLVSPLTTPSLPRFHSIEPISQPNLRGADIDTEMPMIQYVKNLRDSQSLVEPANEASVSRMTKHKR